MDDFDNLDIFDNFKNKKIQQSGQIEEIKQVENMEQNENVELVDNIVKRQKQENQQQLEYLGVQEDEKYERIYDIQNMEIKVENKGCLHEIVIPKGVTRQEQSKRKRAKEYAFALDSFQQISTECLERNESVLVSAHTSAGKTVVAEYAIAMSFREKQRVIYTSPIKALSNQKYRELQDEFQDVGLITGDVSINQNASCLVMTTEILRNMLYKGSQIIRETAWVIFDEIHYMRDKERGVVWEETIILMNQNVRYVFLSATIPNAREFAMWIAAIKNQVTNVVYTDFRPVPLQHYLFPAAADGIHLVVDENSQFREDNFQKAIGYLTEGIDDHVQNIRKKKKQTEGADLFKILKMVFERKFNPVIIFSFSKKEVEGLALSMKQFDFTSEDEKIQIDKIFRSAIGVLSQDDQELPQIEMMLPILKRGIGIHHGGLLPILKEVTEILFQESCIKALFTTDTFAMGLNMPAKTVIFTSVRKFDGEQNRWITGGEYIQMSGRAGRRSIDDKGITILMIDHKMEPEIAKDMLKGKSDRLNSSFHLSYNMLLNSLRIEDIDIEFIVKRSFHQFQNDIALPEMDTKIKQIEQEISSIHIQNEVQVTNIYDLQQQIEQFKLKQKETLIQAKYVLKFMNLGRVVRINKKKEDWGWGIIINLNQKKNINQKGSKKFEESIIIDVMVNVKKLQSNESVEPCLNLNDSNSSMEVVAMLLDNVFEISSVRFTLPKDLMKQENKMLVKATMQKMLNQFQNEPPILDELNILGEDIDLLEGSHLKIRQLTQEKKQLLSQLDNSIDFKQQYIQISNKKKLLQQSTLLNQQIDESQKMVLSEDSKCMKRVLRRLNYIDKNDIIQIKGQVASVISSCDEIVATESMFSGLFNDMQPNEIAALLSCMIHDENSGQDKQIIKNTVIQTKYENILEIAKKMHQVYVDSKITIDETEYLNTFKPQMMDLTYKWCEGATFKEICSECDIFEGSIIRCLRRLDELLKEFQEAAKNIGNNELQQKFSQASTNLKRGIVFAASLYL